jgi:hypothetical protein
LGHDVGDFKPSGALHIILSRQDHMVNPGPALALARQLGIAAKGV